MIALPPQFPQSATNIPTWQPTRAPLARPHHRPPRIARRHRLCCCTTMAFIPLQTSDRSAAGLLRQIEHDIITLVARCTSSSIFQARGATLPLFGVPTPSANASSALGLVSTLPCADEPQHINVTNILEPLFPLAKLPEDVCLSVLSFLPAKELCSVRGVNSESLQTADSHADALWGGLCRHDFPSVASLAARGGVAADQLCPPHQVSFVRRTTHKAHPSRKECRNTGRAGKDQNNSSPLPVPRTWDRSCVMKNMCFGKRHLLSICLEHPPTPAC